MRNQAAKKFDANLFVNAEENVIQELVKEPVPIRRASVQQEPKQKKLLEGKTEKIVEKTLIFSSYVLVVWGISRFLIKRLRLT